DHLLDHALDVALNRFLTSSDGNAATQSENAQLPVACPGIGAGSVSVDGYYCARRYMTGQVSGEHNFRAFFSRYQRTPRKTTLDDLQNLDAEYVHRVLRLSHAMLLSAKQYVLFKTHGSGPMLDVLNGAPAGAPHGVNEVHDAEAEGDSPEARHYSAFDTHVAKVLSWWSGDKVACHLSAVGAYKLATSDRGAWADRLSFGNRYTGASTRPRFIPTSPVTEASKSAREYDLNEKNVTDAAVFIHVITQRAAPGAQPIRRLAARPDPERVRSGGWTGTPRIADAIWLGFPREGPCPTCEGKCDNTLTYVYGCTTTAEAAGDNCQKGAPGANYELDHGAMTIIPTGQGNRGAKRGPPLGQFLSKKKRDPASAQHKMDRGKEETGKLPLNDEATKRQAVTDRGNRPVAAPRALTKLPAHEHAINAIEELCRAGKIAEEEMLERASGYSAGLVLGRTKGGSPLYHMQAYFAAASACRAPSTKKALSAGDAGALLRHALDGKLHHKNNLLAKLLSSLKKAEPADLKSNRVGLGECITRLVCDECAKSTALRVPKKVLEALGTNLTAAEVTNAVATAMGTAIGELVIMRTRDVWVLRGRGRERVEARNAWANGAGRSGHAPLPRPPVPLAPGEEAVMRLSAAGRALAGYPVRAVGRAAFAQPPGSVDEPGTQLHTRTTRNPLKWLSRADAARVLQAEDRADTNMDEDALDAELLGELGDVETHVKRLKTAMEERPLAVGEHVAKLQRLTLAEFEELAPLWTADGAAFGERCLVHERDGKRRKVSSSKCLALLNRARGWMDRIREGDPKIVVSDSQKRELMRARLLLASSIDSYVIEAHWIGGIESALASAREAAPTDAAGILRKQLHISNTSSTSQTLGLWEARDWPVANSGVSDEVRADWLLSGKWIRDAQQHVEWTASDGNKHHVVQGMCSRIRGTSLRNLMFQAAYTDTGLAQAAELGCVSEGPAEYRKSGDDAALRLRRLLALITNVLSVYPSGHVLKEKAQSFSAESAEYLRILYDETGVHGYEERALGTLILRDANRDWELPLDGVLGGLATTTGDLIRSCYWPLATLRIADAVMRNDRAHGGVSGLFSQSTHWKVPMQLVRTLGVGQATNYSNLEFTDRTAAKMVADSPSRRAHYEPGGKVDARAVAHNEVSEDVQLQLVDSKFTPGETGMLLRRGNEIVAKHAATLPKVQCDATEWKGNEHRTEATWWNGQWRRVQGILTVLALPPHTGKFTSAAAYGFEDADELATHQYFNASRLAEHLDGLRGRRIATYAFGALEELPDDVVIITCRMDLCTLRAQHLLGGRRADRSDWRDSRETLATEWVRHSDTIENARCSMIVLANPGLVLSPKVLVTRYTVDPSEAGVLAFQRALDEVQDDYHAEAARGAGFPGHRLAAEVTRRAWAQHPFSRAGFNYLLRENKGKYGPAYRAASFAAPIPPTLASLLSGAG
ncbi:unnamed protein product, partial [Prorocentrum cordatum]